MTDTTTALATTGNASPPAPARKPRQPTVSKRLREALRLLETGECKTQKAACERVGMSQQHLSRALGYVHVQAFIAQQRARNLQRGALRASARYVELVDAESEQVAEKAARSILLTAGDLKAEKTGGSTVSVQVGVSVQAGYVIDLSEPGGAALIHNQRQNGAKPLTALDVVPNEQSERGDV